MPSAARYNIINNEIINFVKKKKLFYFKSLGQQVYYSVKITSCVIGNFQVLFRNSIFINPSLDLGIRQMGCLHVSYNTDFSEKKIIQSIKKC